MNMVNSFALNQTIPFLNNTANQSMNIINQQYQSFSDLYGSIPVKFYLIGNIFDSSYLANYNQLQYNSLCSNITNTTAPPCNTFYG
jgi:hypothetical protein